eukprot:8183735-Prorocentrum_lima.AAC.1
MAGHPDWHRRAKLLRTALETHSCQHRCRSPHALWSLIWQTTLPPAATWERLLGRHITLELLAQRLSAGGAHRGTQVASSNIRWLRYPHSERGRAKTRR